MEKAPVVVFAFNRSDHLEKTLKALNDCKDAQDSQLFIFCDQWKKETQKESVEKVRNLVDNFVLISNFKNTTVVKADQNKGLAKSIIEGITAIIHQFGKVIVLEDDLIVTKNFLQYMNEALTFYENADDVWAISGYTFDMEALKDYKHDIYYAGRGCSWGWATWENRWNSVDWQVASYSKFKYNIAKRRAFGKWGKDLPQMLDMQMGMDINSWAIRWCYEAFKQKKYTIYPKYSYLSNIGIDGSGVHSAYADKGMAEKYQANISQNPEYIVKFERLNEDRKIRRQFQKHFSNGFISDTKDIIKSLMIRLGWWQSYERRKKQRKEK